MSDSENKCVALWRRNRGDKIATNPCGQKARWQVRFCGCAINVCRYHRVMVCRELDRLNHHSEYVKLQQPKQPKAAKAAS